jgi:hypothetical protein
MLRRLRRARPRRGDPADTREWHPQMPEQLDDAELADWRAGRNAVYQLAALTIGARLADADTRGTARPGSVSGPILFSRRLRKERPNAVDGRRVAA